MKLSFAVACLLGLVAADEPVWKLSSVIGHRDDQETQKGYGDYSTGAADSRPPYKSTLQVDNKDEPVWKLSSVLGHKDDSDTQKAYGDHSTVKANGRPPYQSAAQVESDSESSDSDSESDEEHPNVAIGASKVIDKSPIYNAWESVKDGAPDGKYERVVTFNFASDSDDSFMRSMIKSYAHEARTPLEELDDGEKIGGEPTGAFWMSKKDMARASKEVLGTHKGLTGGAYDDYMDTYFDRAWDEFDVNGDGAIEVIKTPQFMRFLASDQTMGLGENN